MHDDAAAALAPLRWSPAAGRLLAGLGRQLVAERERWFLWVPVALGCGIATAFALPALPPSPLGIATLTAGLVGLLALVGPGSARLGEATVAALAMAAALLLGFGLAVARTHAVAAPVLDRPGLYEVTGRIVLLEETAGGRRLLLDEVALAGRPPGATPHRVRLTVRGDRPALKPGDRVAARARLQPPMGPAMPGGFDFARQAWFAGLGGLGYGLGTPRLVEAAPPGLDLAVARLRAGVSQRITALAPGDAGAVATALLTGSRAGIGQEVWRSFQVSGLAHLLAISGLHMVLVAGTILLAVRYLLALVPPLALRVPVKKLAAVMALLGAAFYMVLAGGTVPTQRAFLMIAVGLVGIVADRDPISMRLLAVAALAVLAWQPESLLGASFQLSFAAVMALVAVYEAPAVREWLRPAAEEGWAWRALRYVLGVAATTLIAGLATAPFAAFHFQTIPTYGLVANLIAVPITSFWVMPAGLLTLLAMPFGLDAWTVPVMAAGVEAVLATARWAAGLPGASLAVPLLPSRTLVLVGCGAVWLCLWRQRWRWLGVVPIALAVGLALAHRPPDLLVTPRLDMAAVRLEDGRVALLEWRRQSLVRDAWLRGLAASGEPVRPQSWAEPVDGLACDAAGCVLRRDGVAVSLARGIRAAIEDCGRADLLVAFQTPRRCAAPTRLVGWRELVASGGLAVRIDAGGVALETVAERRGRWPWAQ